MRRHHPSFPLASAVCLAILLYTFLVAGAPGTVWAQAVPGEATPVTQAQKDAFVATLRQAVRNGDPTLLEPLMGTAGMSIADVAWNRQALPPLLAAMGSSPAALRFSWGPPPAGGAIFPGQGPRFGASCTPVLTLRVTVTSQPGNETTLPLCLEDGQLKRVGVIRAPTP
ncbi:hypothetical protein [Megalodesulfovibrio paquesii]